MPHSHDHELKIDSTTNQFYLVRDDQGAVMYQVIEEVPQYQPNLRFTQTNWIGGHGQVKYRQGDKYFEGQSIDTTQVGKLFLAPEITVVKDDANPLDSEPVGFFWAETIGKWLCFTAGKVYIYDGTDWDAATTTLVRVKQIVEFDGNLYAARGQATPGTWAAGDEYYTSANGSDWTVAALTDCYALGFLVAPNPAGTAENLWKFKTPNELSRTSAIGTQWESPTYIGETANNITNIFLNGDKLYGGKEDSLSWLDSNGGVHSELPDELKVNHSTDNFKYVANWQTSTYFSIQRGIGEMTTSSTYRPISPLTDIEDIGKVGDIVGISSDKDWLYVAIDEGTSTHIYKGRETLIGNQLRWEWCPWIYLGAYTCAAIRVCQHTTTDRRLWFGYTTGSTYATAYVILSDNPLADSAARFCAAGWLRMSYTYGSDPNWDKLWQSAVIEQTRYDSGAETAASSGETVSLKYRDDTDLAVVSTALIAAYSTAGVVETNFSSALTNKRICFELYLASDTNTATPVVTLFQAKGTEKPTTVRIHEAYYKVGDKPSERAKTIRALLRTARSSTTLIKFADLRYGQKTSGTSSGDYVWCVLEPGTPQEVEVKHEKYRQPELAIKVRLREVSFTIS
uniref:Uncharacterized protein n=2 Tax=viral metagenome TaxID=1070528 RepID=A0A6M3K289_9ZZZZ